MAYGGDLPEPMKNLQRQVLQKIERARKDRSDRAALLNETYRLALPHRRRVGSGLNTKTAALTEDDVADVVDATLAETMEDFASDMIAQFTPDNEPWARMRPVGDIPDEYRRDVQAATSEAEMKVFEEIEKSSYYDAAHQCFSDLANGTMAMRARRPARAGDMLEFEPIEPADLLICHSQARGVADGRFTEGKITVKEYKSLYGLHAEMPKNRSMRNDDDEIVLIDGFYRCWENRKGDRAWRRIVMVDNELVYEKYFNDEPDVDLFLARWKVDGRSAWGVGPAFRAQPAQRALNELTTLLMVALSKHVDPPTIYHDDGIVNFEQGFEAGDMIPAGKDFEWWQWEAKGRFDVTFFTEQDLRAQIRRALFQDKPEQMGKTPPTATQWQELDVRARMRWEIPRGKIVREWVIPIVMWTMNELTRQGRLQPVTIDERVIRIEPFSPFAKARSNEKVTRARDLLGMFAQLSPDTFPADVDLAQTLRNFKAETGDELVEVRTDEDRAEIMNAMTQPAATPQA